MGLPTMISMFKDKRIMTNEVEELRARLHEVSLAYNTLLERVYAAQAGTAVQPAPVPVPPGMVMVTRDEASNYCRILTLLGMEEEGDPVAEIVRLHTPPPPANLSTAPAPLNTNDRAMWVLGWNECRDSVIAAHGIAAPSEVTRG